MSATAIRPAVATTRAAVPRGAAMPYLLAAALFLAYACWSIHRHLRLRTSGYDLGIFEQAIRGYAHLGAPDSTIKAPGFNLLGDHFHPILVVLAPLRSPLLLAAVPTLAWRFWSTNPSYWGTGYQYSAVLMPITFVAFLDALPATGTGRRARAAAHAACMIALAATMLTPYRCAAS